MGTGNEIDNAGTALLDAFVESAEPGVDDDSIEFGDGVVHSDVVSFDKKSNEEQPKVEPVVEEEEEIVPISHKGEGTLLVGSAQLDLVEELDGEKKAKKQHHGLIITTIFLIIICIALALIYFFVIKNAGDEQNGDVAEETQGGDKVKLDRSFKYYHYKTTPMADSVLINGVPPKLSDGYYDNDELPLLRNSENMLTFDEDKSVPLSVIIEKNRDPVDDPIEYLLTEGDIYRKTSLIIKPPSNMDLSAGVYYLNGKETTPLKELEVKVMSGMPFFIHVHQKDMGDHLHVIWPTKTREEIELPPLELLTNSERATQFNINVPKEYLLDKSFVLDVLAEKEYTHKPGLRTIAKGELITIDMKKNSREPMKMILDSTPFGSITIDSYLKLSTTNYAIVKFDKESPRDVTLCFRRTAEAFCTTMGEENEVPTGTWEIKAYRMVDGKKEWFENAPYEEIKSNFRYTLNVRVKGDKFELSLNPKPAKFKKK